MAVKSLIMSVIHKDFIKLFTCFWLTKYGSYWQRFAETLLMGGLEKLYFIGYCISAVNAFYCLLYNIMFLILAELLHSPSFNFVE